MYQHSVERVRDTRLSPYKTGTPHRGYRTINIHLQIYYYIKIVAMDHATTTAVLGVRVACENMRIIEDDTCKATAVVATTRSSFDQTLTRVGFLLPGTMLLNSAVLAPISKDVSASTDRCSTSLDANPIHSDFPPCRLQPTACVLHITLVFPPIYTQHKQCWCRCLLERRALWSQTTRQRYTLQTQQGDLAMRWPQ